MSESSQLQRSSLPAFLKQFDPYAVLEPERVAGNTASKNNDRKNDTDSVLGSLLTVMKEVDVLDLLDNLFVSPHQVSDNASSSGTGSSFNEEFSKFLDKYESPKVEKLIDLPDTKEFDSQNKCGCHEEMDKDLLKMLSKEYLTKDGHQTPRQLSQNDLHVTELCAKNIKINSSVRCPEISLSKLNNHSAKISTAPTLTPSNSQQCKVLIETVSKDPKVFKKRRILKSEAETSKYTKGANLYEKSIVLPQIMERLKKRKIAYDLKKNLTKKLVLDTETVQVASRSGDENNSDAVSGKIKLNCPSCKGAGKIQIEKGVNDYKIAAVGTVKSKVQNGVQSSPSSSKVTNITVFNEPNDIGSLNTAPGLKDIQKQILKSLIFNTNNNSAPSPSKEPSADKNKGVDTNSTSEEGNLSPEVLMEDCNKERLTEFIRRRLFQKFVQGNI